jgi:drug/metabolite transporter (DMT)-like permease
MSAGGTASGAAHRRLAVLAIVVANVLGGVSYPAQKAALAGLPPATVTMLRGLVALVPLVFMVARSRTRLSWTRAENWRVFLLGTVAYALPMWLGIVGVERSTASNAAILILLEPVTIVILAWLWLGEHVGLLKLASVALGLGGALCIVLEGAALDDLFAGEHFLGNALLALHGVLWGMHTPLAKPLAARHDPYDLTLRVTLAGTLALTPAVWLERSAWRAGPELVPSLLWSAAVGLLVSFGAIAMWLWALRHISATSVAGFVFLQPLTGVLVGVGFMGEHLSSAALAGTGLIVAGVGLDAVLTAARGRARAAPRTD